MKDIAITLGSLFDGIGAVPLTASFFGITTLWASEILPNAISVTKRHFPQMAHLGDVTKLNGGEIPPVRVLAFGSPCQSWSIAGSRTGFEGKSGLFMEAIRIIREMRCATNGKKPEIVLFENVPGLLSSKSSGGYAGSDYKTVLEAFTEKEIPMPESGRWANAGMVRGGGIDLAWVIKDSQYHRTAQRRRRLFLVVDFAGQRAGEILFITQSMSGYFAARESEGKGTAVHAESRAGGTGGDGGISVFMAGQAKNARSIAYSESISPTLKGSPSGLNQVPCVCEPQLARTLMARSDSSPCADRGQNIVAVCAERNGAPSALTETDKNIHPNITGTLCASGAGMSRPAGNANETDLCVAYCLQGNMIDRKDENGPRGSGINTELSFTLSATDRHAVAYGESCYCDYKEGQVSALKASGGTLGGGSETLVAAVDCRNLNEGEISGTLQSKCGGGYSLNYTNPVRMGYIVRRLTPVECELLMSLPHGWTEYGHDGRLLSDSARYQLCGNSIVVNVLAYIMKNIAELLAGKEA